MSENGAQMLQKWLKERAKRILKLLAQHIKVGYERGGRGGTTDFGKLASHCSIRNVHNTIHEMLGHHNVCACWVSICLKEENSAFRERSFIFSTADSRRKRQGCIQFL
jgi:hypothetical protein